MGALLLIPIKLLTIVAPNTFGHQNFRSLNRPPLTGFLTDLTSIAFTPSLDPENGEIGNQSERCSQGAKITAIEVPDEHRCEQENPQHDPHDRRPAEGEHPERFDISINRIVPGDQKIRDRRSQEGIFDIDGPTFQPRWKLEPESGRDHPVQKLSQSPKRAYSAAVQPSPQQGGCKGEDNKQIPGEIVFKKWEVPLQDSEDIDHGDEAAP